MKKNQVTIKRYLETKVNGINSILFYFPQPCKHIGCNTLHYSVRISSSEGNKLEAVCPNCQSIMTFVKQ